MKQYISKTLFVAAAAVLALTACDDNSWNKDYLDGFEDAMPDINKDVQTVEYTLTDDDYATLAGLSANKALAGDELKDELANVGKLKRFTDAISAEKYMPAFLASSGFAYFALNDGSAVKVTFNQADALPEELEKLNAAGSYTLSADDYKTVWGSEEDYAEALSPAHAPKQAIPALLKALKPEAVLGDYMVVNYNYSATDPVFDTSDIPARDPQTIVFDASADRNDEELKAFWQAIVDWVFETQDVPLGSTGITSGEGYVTSYGNNEYWSGASAYQVNADLRGSKAIAQYAAGYEGMTEEQVSELMFTRFKEQSLPYALGKKYTDLVDGDVFKVTYKTYTGVTASYIATYEVKDGAITFVSNVSADAAAAPAKAPARVAEVASVKSTDVFYFDGSKWSVPDNVIAISDAQCIEITGRYNTLTAAQADANLPIFLKVNYPYATADTQKYVVYNEYKTGYVARQYIYDGSEWAENDGIEQTTLQFVRKDGQWLADPSVVITLPIGKNQELSMQYYQACCDWVYENIDVPLGSTSITSGFGYVTSFGNNEYYTGASAYQGNVDLRADKAVAQYPDGYAGMSDAEVVALMKKRFEEEVMPAVLAKFHPDLAPMDGVQVTLTLVFGTYDGSNRTETARWEVVAPGEFKFLDCTWNKAE